MREPNICPVCDGRAGRTETVVIDGKEVLKYWHTDLEECQEYCLEYPCGDKKQVFECQGDYQPTGPRAD